MLISTVQDMLGVVRRHDEAIARWISHVVSPHVVGVVLTSLTALYFSNDPITIFIWLMGLMPLIVLPPLMYLLWLVRVGKLEDIYMPTRETRLAPLGVMMVWMIICLGLVRYWQAPRIVEVFLIATVVLVAILGVVTIFWKISFHGATITAAATTTLLVAGSHTWPIILLVPLVGWARIRLKRHTPRQVIFGSLVGAGIALILAQILLTNFG